MNFVSYHGSSQEFEMNKVTCVRCRNEICLHRVSSAALESHECDSCFYYENEPEINYYEEIDLDMEVDEDYFDMDVEEEEFEDPNSIKVVVDRELHAVYMSRRPIPTRATPGVDDIFKQVCVIPFRRDFLIEYTELEPTPLEIHESIDMLRVIEHGMHVHMAPTVGFSQAVDTPADLAKVEELMRAGG